MLLIVASIVEASKKRKRDGNGKKSKKKMPALTTLYDAPGSGGETPVGRNSGSGLESEKAKDIRASVGKTSSTGGGSSSEVMPSTASESGININDALGRGFREAVDGRNFGWLWTNWRDWGERRDLLDDVIAKGAETTVWFIQNAEYTRWRTFAALFDKGEGMIDGVLGRVNYHDGGLCILTEFRPELAGSSEKFFRILDKTREPRMQEVVVCRSVENLFAAGKHDLIGPFVNALGGRTFKSDRLKGKAIQMAFEEGARRGNQDIVKEYYEHPSITSEKYANGLYESWDYGKSNRVFPFLLKQADQGDVEAVKEEYACKEYPEFRQAIDEAFRTTAPAGSRIISDNRAQRLLANFAPITGASVGDRPDSIINNYPLGERERTKESELEVHKKKIPASITLYDAPGSGGETPVGGNFGSRLESRKAKDNRASGGGASSTVGGSSSEVVSTAASESSTKINDVFGKEFRGAVEGRNFGWLRASWMSWEKRKDLLDDVIAKGADFAVRLIRNVEDAKRRVLAALFDKGKERTVDDVLGGIKYDDDDLVHLTVYRPELASPPEKFFRVLDRIKAPTMQVSAVYLGVENLFKAGKHDLVVPLINALGTRTFRSDRLREEAIRLAFEKGARRGDQDIVELWYEYPAVTSNEYAVGLYQSWEWCKPKVFRFLLKQADQRDLDVAKKKYEYEKCKEEFLQTIDRAFKIAPPAGSRHLRLIERTVLGVLASITGASNKHGPGRIISAYILGEKEKTKGSDSVMQKAGTKNRTD